MSRMTKREEMLIMSHRERIPSDISSAFYDAAHAYEQAECDGRGSKYWSKASRLSKKAWAKHAVYVEQQRKQWRKRDDEAANQ